MSNPRDTQFAKFADLLFYDLDWGDVNIDMYKEGWEDRWMRCIAQRTYDLVKHTLQHTSCSDLDRLSPDERVAGIPDLTEWPVQEVPGD